MPCDLPRLAPPLVNQMQITNPVSDDGVCCCELLKVLRVQIPVPRIRPARNARAYPRYAEAATILETWMVLLAISNVPVTVTCLPSYFFASS